MRGVGFQKLAFARVGGAAIGRQFGACEETCGARIEAKEIVLVDPLKIEQQRQRLPHPDVGKYRTARVEDKELRRLRHPGLDRVADYLAVAGSREIIAVVPAQRLGLDAKVVEAA